ncbi:MAG: sugar nucleotide-binding protein, partial [Candidatus Marinimicrobia bacterium]|nr:sugar nucleotide-binding protein [Candidatus Neomarinimicrobiota bacterium]
VDSLKNAKDINIVEDQYNNPTWSDDLAEASAILLQENVKGIFNYGGNDYMSRLEFARMIAKVFDLNANFIHPITTASLDLPAPRPLRGGLVNDKIQNFQKIPDRKIIDILNIMKGLTQ